MSRCNGTTHYMGCECHENEWAAKLAIKDGQLSTARRELKEAHEDALKFFGQLAIRNGELEEARERIEKQRICHGEQTDRIFELVSERDKAREEVERLKELLARATDMITEATKRSNYAWSSGGDYSPQEWKNEGAISLAGTLLAALRGGQGT